MCSATIVTVCVLSATMETTLDWSCVYIVSNNGDYSTLYVCCQQQWWLLRVLSATMETTLHCTCVVSNNGDYSTLYVCCQQQWRLLYTVRVLSATMMTTLHSTCVVSNNGDYSILYVCCQQQWWLLDTVRVLSATMVTTRHCTCVVSNNGDYATQYVHCQQQWWLLYTVHPPKWHDTFHKSLSDQILAQLAIICYAVHHSNTLLVIDSTHGKLNRWCFQGQTLLAVPFAKYWFYHSWYTLLLYTKGKHLHQWLLRLIVILCCLNTNTGSLYILGK
jgi:hypothetical protein